MTGEKGIDGWREGSCRKEESGKRNGLWPVQMSVPLAGRDPIRGVDGGNRLEAQVWLR